MKRIITLIMIGSIIMTSCEKQPDVAVISTKYGDMVLEFYPTLRKSMWTALLRTRKTDTLMALPFTG